MSETSYLNGFYSGISSDPMQGPQGSFYDGKNITNAYSVGYIEVANSMTMAPFTIGDYSTYAMKGSNGNTYSISTAGKLYMNYSLLTSPASSGGGSIVEFNNKILRKQTDKIHTTALNGTGLVTDNYTLTGANITGSFVEHNGELYIASGKNIYIIDKLTTSGTIPSVLEVSDNIIALMLISSYFYIVTKRGYYIRQGISTAPDQFVPLEVDILGAGKIGTKVFITAISSFGYTLYQIEGTAITPIFGEPVDTLNKRLFMHRALDGISNNVGSLGDSIMFPGNNCLYIYGSQSAGVTASLKKVDLIINTFYNINNNFIMIQDNTGIGGGGANRIWRYLGESHDSGYRKGYIEGHPEIGGLVSQEKSSKNLRIAHELDENSEVFVSVKYDNNIAKKASFFAIGNLDLSEGATYDLAGCRFRIDKIVTRTPASGTKCNYIETTMIIGDDFSDIYTDTTHQLARTSGTGEVNISFIDFCEYQFHDLSTEIGLKNKTLETGGVEYLIVQHRCDIFARLYSRPKFYDLTYTYDRSSTDIG